MLRHRQCVRILHLACAVLQIRRDMKAFHNVTSRFDGCKALAREVYDRDEVLIEEPSPLHIKHQYDKDGQPSKIF